MMQFDQKKSKYDAPAALVDNPNKGIDIANFSG